MKSTEVRLESLRKQYNRLTAVDNVSLTIEPGSMIALLGPSGCGKTTCLRMIAGLVQPTSGSIFVNNANITNVPVHRRNIGMLFQNYALFPHLTVEENIAFGLEMRGISKSDAAKRVADALS
jgi:putative spermidine/putrescine transport system ATP-binding protein